MEITMRDEMDMRMWNAHHSDFSDTVARGFAAIGEGFRKLTAIQYAAPWNARRKDCRS